MTPAPQEYVQPITALLEGLSTTEFGMRLRPEFTPFLEADSECVQFKLGKRKGDDGLTMFLRVSLQHYKPEDGRYVLTLDAKARIMAACEAFCQGQGPNFAV